MSEVIQRFLLNNTKFIQHVFNNKLAKRGGKIGKAFTWMQLGKRTNGEHIIPKWFRFWNTYMLHFGFRFNWERPHLTKLMTKEREIFMAAYSGLFIIWAWLYKKNKIRPLYRYQDYHLHDYDNPASLSHKYKMYVPFYVSNYKESAHYLEIKKIVFEEMWKKFLPIKEQIESEFNHASEKVKRTKYCLNSNYVYEPFGWEMNREE